jgi:WD40 repeat protein
MHYIILDHNQLILTNQELLILFDLQSYKIDKFMSLGQEVTSLCLAPSNSILLAGTSDSTIHIIDTETFTILSSHPGLPSEVTSIIPIAA